MQDHGPGEPARPALPDAVGPVLPRNRHVEVIAVQHLELAPTFDGIPTPAIRRHPLHGAGSLPSDCISQGADVTPKRSLEWTADHRYLHSDSSPGSQARALPSN